jgi:hypothetical protein
MLEKCYLMWFLDCDTHPSSRSCRGSKASGGSPGDAISTCSAPPRAELSHGGRGPDSRQQLFMCNHKIKIALFNRYLMIFAGQAPVLGQRSPRA